MSITPQMMAEIDQSSKAICDAYPPLWRSMYLGLVKEGFTEQQAMELLKTFIQAMHKH